MRLLGVLAAIAIVAACVGDEANSVTPPPAPLPDASIAQDAAPDASCASDLQGDSTNCGSCGHDCLGGRCEMGKCQPVDLTNGQMIPSECNKPESAPNCVAGTYAGLVLDGTDLYFGDRGTQNPDPSGGILRLNKDVAGPTTPEVVVTKGAVFAINIAGNDIYWQASDGIRRVAKTGGTDALAKASNGRRHVKSFVTANGELIWATTNSVLVQKLDVDSASPEAITDTDTRDVLALAVEGDLVAWWNSDNEILIRDRSTSAEAKRITLQKAAEVGVMTFYNGRLYWVVEGGAVLTADPRNPFPGRLGETDVFPYTIAVDESGVYVGAWGSCRTKDCGIDGKIFRLPRQTGGQVEVLHHGIQLPTALVVDERAIYWTTWFMHSVRRLAK